MADLRNYQAPRYGTAGVQADAFHDPGHRPLQPTQLVAALQHVAADVGERIRREHHVSHVTVQPEAPDLAPALHSAESLLRSSSS